MIGYYKLMIGSMMYNTFTSCKYARYCVVLSRLKKKGQINA